EVSLEQHVREKDERIVVHDLPGADDRIRLAEHLGLLDELDGYVVGRAGPGLDLLAKISGDEDELFGVLTHHPVEHMLEHRLACDRDQRFRLAPGVRAKASTEAGYGQNDVHEEILSAQVQYQSLRQILREIRVQVLANIRSERLQRPRTGEFEDVGVEPGSHGGPQERPATSSCKLRTLPPSCGHDLLDTLASGDVLPQYDRLEPIRLMRQHHAAGVAKIEMKHFVVFQAMQGRPGVGGDQVENRRPMRVGPRIDAWHLA